MIVWAFYILVIITPGTEPVTLRVPAFATQTGCEAERAALTERLDGVLLFPCRPTFLALEKAWKHVKEEYPDDERRTPGPPGGQPGACSMQRTRARTRREQ